MKTLIALGFLATCVFAGCSDSNHTSNSASDSGKQNVVCTTNIVCDLIKQIGGDRLSVSAIMDGPGIDPHTYTPSPTDTYRLMEADVVVYSGLHLEGQMQEALESLRLRNIHVICVTDLLQEKFPDRLLTSEQGLPDPHVWFDPELWAECGQSVSDQLTKIDADGADVYSKNAVEFRASMSKLKQDGMAALSGLPTDRRILVTAHDAFEYFARCFEFQVEAVQGISTESEPGLKRINQLVQMLVDQEIAAVFTEQSVSDRNIQALLSGCQSNGHKLAIGGKLYSDTIGIQDGSEGTLQKALMYNIKQISSGLGGPLREPSK